MGDKFVGNGLSHSEKTKHKCQNDKPFLDLKRKN